MSVMGFGVYLAENAMLAIKREFEQEWKNEMNVAKVVSRDVVGKESAMRLIESGRWKNTTISEDSKYAKQD